MKRLAAVILLIIAAVIQTLADNPVPKVPSQMEFGDMKLKLTEAARNEIQRDVNALHSSRKYFDIKLDRVNLYFPIIEEIFKEEEIPEDFKYLVIQESALISDAVSSANAVGYWQFKDFTGKEVGLRIDKQVDERLNIVAATHGAAKYMKRNNFYFRNWIYSLMAYNTGRGGAQRFVKEKNFGVKSMVIDKNTHWYVKKFLAHKVAFEKEIGGQHSEGLRLETTTKEGGKSLEKIARSYGVEYSLMSQYNKWLLRGNVPEDKEYSVVLPSYRRIKTKDLAEQKSKKEEPTSDKVYGDLEEILDGKVEVMTIKLNGLPAVMATEGDNMKSLSAKTSMDIRRLAKFNEISEQHAVIPGEFYYTKKKSKKANIYYYTAQEGETLWSISQKFGVRIGQVAKFNRMNIIDGVKPGRVLWLRKKRPADVAIEYRDLATPENDKKGLYELKIQENLPEPRKPIVADTATSRETEDEYVAPETSIPKATKRNTHVVQPGESLYAISRIYDVGVMEIVEWNQLPDFVIQPGQRLIINVGVPESYEEETKDPVKKKIVFHEVEPGDTLYSISRRYGVSVEYIMKLNGLDNYNISVGDKIKVDED
ncbi:MAG: LysM peptidoglycan-binding domain-containing protein [Bacteroidota bacterium]